VDIPNGEIKLHSGFPRLDFYSNRLFDVHPIRGIPLWWTSVTKWRRYWIFIPFRTFSKTEPRATQVILALEKKLSATLMLYLKWVSHLIGEKPARKLMEFFAITIAIFVTFSVALRLYFCLVGQFCSKCEHTLNRKSVVHQCHILP
jgi:hypothetical protein